MRIAVVLAALMFVTPAQAQSDPAEEFEHAAREAARRILGALELLVMAVPQYEAPEMLPNGDIIIRRKPRPGEPYVPYEGPCQTDGDPTI